MLPLASSYLKKVAQSNVRQVIGFFDLCFWGSPGSQTYSCIFLLVFVFSTNNQRLPV